MSDISDALDPAIAAFLPKEASLKPVANFLVEDNEAGEPGSSESSEKRAATPPLKLKMYHPQAAHDSDSDNEEIHIVDPVRAALTWHEDEITVYDPDDKDDDGTGINGIGFRPTPAIAHARSLKRRQQITEYRKREESEARARRNQRRREGETPSGIGKASPRKVRFSDSELRNIAVTI